jgi:hypothetical protein
MLLIRALNSAREPVEKFALHLEQRPAKDQDTERESNVVDNPNIGSMSEIERPET